MVVFLTDGILEARAPDGTVFGADRALQVVRCYLRDSAHLLADNLYHAVCAFSQNAPQHDDITVVVAKVEGGP
jgi:sigma-B regulation protein RsbU (phosphoserine phosphatase)